MTEFRKDEYKKVQIPFGYNGKLEKVMLSLFHTFFVAMTGHGKTLGMKSLLFRFHEVFPDWKILILDSKDKRDFADLNSDIPICFVETTDPLDLKNLLEPVVGAKLMYYFDKIIEEAVFDTLGEIHRSIHRKVQDADCHNIKISGKDLGKLRVIDYTMGKLVALVEKPNIVRELKLHDGFNVMPVALPDVKNPNLKRAFQQLIVRSVLLLLLSDQSLEKTLLVLDESHKWCLSEDTEVLTFDGWKPIMQVHKGELVMTCKMEMQKLEYQSAQDVAVFDHQGELFHINNTETADILATEEHRHLIDKQVRTRRKGKYVAYWKNKPCLSKVNDFPRTFRVPAAYPFDGGLVWKDRAFLCLLAWIITDGHVNCYYKEKPYVIRLNQSKKQHIPTIRSLIQRAELACSESVKPASMDRYIIHRGKQKLIKSKPSQRFTFNVEASAKIIKALDGQVHRIPRWVFNVDRKSRLAFFESLVDGDGTYQITKRDDRPIIFYAGLSKELADDVQELCIGLGYRATVTFADAMWKVYISRRFPYHYVYRRDIAKVPYNGKVCCLSVVNETFVARRNGKVFITGNSSQRYASICKQPLSEFVSEGRSQDKFVWLSDQALTKVDKEPLKNIKIWVVGQQMESNEVEDARETVNSITDLNVKDSDIKTLKVGNFILVDGLHGKVERAYLQPYTVPEDVALKIVQGADPELAEPYIRRFEEGLLKSQSQDGDEEMVWKGKFEKLEKEFEEFRKTTGIEVSKLRKDLCDSEERENDLNSELEKMQSLRQAFRDFFSVPMAAEGKVEAGVKVTLGKSLTEISLEDNAPKEVSMTTQDPSGKLMYCAVRLHERYLKDLSRTDDKPTFTTAELQKEAAEHGWGLTNMMIGKTTGFLIREAYLIKEGSGLRLPTELKINVQEPKQK